MIRIYRKYIAENRGLVYISTLLAILLRIGFLFTSEYQPEADQSILTDHFSVLFENRYISFACSLLLTALIGLQLSYLNDKYTLIRGKTSLPYVFTLLLLSALPDYIYLISPYIGIIVILLCVQILFSSYHQAKASRQAFSIGFALGVASLVFPGLLLYLLIFWIGFSYMRSFSFKAFLASLFAVGMVYWLKVSYLIFTQSSSGFWEILTCDWDDFYNLEVLSLERVGGWALIALYTLVVLVAVFNSYIHKLDDKIQVRINFLFLKRLLLFSAILYAFLRYHAAINLIIAIIISGFILSHFFALADKKWKVYFFLLLLVFYFANYAWWILFLNKL